MAARLSDVRPLPVTRLERAPSQEPARQRSMSIGIGWLAAGALEYLVFEVLQRPPEIIVGQTGSEASFSAAAWMSFFIAVPQLGPAPPAVNRLDAICRAIAAAINATVLLCTFMVQ